MQPGTSHQIKTQRALRRSRIGANPNSASAMLAAIPESAIAALTAQQLADLIDAMWRICQDSKEIADREAASNGAVWVDGVWHEVAA